MTSTGTLFDFSDRAATHRSIALMLSALIVVSLPFSRAINSISIGLLALNWLVEGQFARKWESLRSNRLIWLFAGGYLWLLVTMLWTANTGSGLSDVEGKLSILIMPLILGTSNWMGKKQVAFILKAFAAAVAVGALVCHVNAVHLIIENDREWSAFFGGYHTYSALVAPLKINPAYMAMYACFAILGIWWLLWRKQVTALRWLWIGIGLYLTFFTLHLGARMGILALGLLAVVALFVRQREAGNLKPFVIGVLAIGVLAAGVLLGLERTRMRFEKLFEPNEELARLENSPLKTFPERIAIWYCAWEAITEQPLVGTGIGDVHDTLNEKYAKYDFHRGLDRDLNSHNQFIEAWLAMGIVGLLLLLAAIFLPLRIAWNQRNAIYLLFLLLVFLSLLTENTLNTQQGVVFYAFFNALLAFRDSEG